MNVPLCPALQRKSLPIAGGCAVSCADTDDRVRSVGTSPPCDSAPAGKPENAWLGVSTSKSSLSPSRRTVTLIAPELCWICTVSSSRFRKEKVVKAVPDGSRVPSPAALGRANSHPSASWSPVLMGRFGTAPTPVRFTGRQKRNRTPQIAKASDAPRAGRPDLAQRILSVK